MLLNYLLNFVSLIALLPLIFAQHRCNISDSQLNLQLGKGIIRQLNWPYNMAAQQHCVWTFPNEKFAGKALFLFISVMNMFEERSEEISDLTIGNEPPVSQMPTANCRLYGEPISNVNTTALSIFFASRHGPSKRHCTAWFIDNRPVDRLTFRSFGDDGGVFNIRGFYIFYDYITVHKEGKMEAMSPTPPSNFTIKGKMGAMSPTRPSDFTIKGSTTMNFDEQNLQNGCERQTTNIPIIVLATLLVIVCLLLIYVLVRQRRSQSTVLPRKKNSDGYDDYTNSAYASTKNTPYENEDDRASIPTYDVPTNNRLRTPTIASCVSSGSECRYQVPNSRPVVVDHPVPEQPDTESGCFYAEIRKDKESTDLVAKVFPEQPHTNVRDVYAVVQKRQEQ